MTDPKGYVYNYGYDKDDRLTLTTDPLEQTTGYTYDAVNRVTAYRDKMGLTESYLYDAHGNVLEKTATDGRVTEYTYDAKNRLTSVTDPMGSVAYYTYDVMDRVTGVTDYLGRGTEFTYDREGNVTSVTDAAGRKEVCTYDIAGRITSYTSNGGNRISYDYDKLDDLVEKSYSDSTGEQSAEGVTYAYNALGERVAMQDTTGDTEYTYDGLRRITSVTTYRAPGEDGFSHEEAKGDTIGYTYDEADHLAAITYADGTKVSYEYDKNDNLIKVTDREGKVTTYTYDAINRVTRIHRPNGISTYNTYNARNQIVELKNVCDTCEWVVSDYLYTYDDRGFIAGETAIESLAGYAYDDKHNGRHDDGRHDDLYPHGNRHNGKHDKDATFAYQIVETDRTFTYDAAGKLLTATETEDNYGTCVYTFEYDLMGNRTYMEKTLNGTVVEWHRYEYNESNQLISEKLYNGKKTTSLAYTYDADGNRISETGRIGTDKVNRTYEYSVENRLAAVHDGDELLLAAAYDGDGNRVFLLNYNLHTDDDWKGNSGNGNGNNKDNSGSGNKGNGNSGNNGNGNGNGKGKGNNKKNSKSGGTDDAGYGNATNAEENNSQNQCGILFPLQEEVSATEADLIARIKTTGKEKNYELIEYLNDVNREHAEVLVEQNINGRTDTSYIYGAEIKGGFDRISLDRFDGSTGYYLYDARGSVSGITNEEGQVYQSYRYSVTGEITFGAPQYENEYTYNGESYNPNIESQYLRARYYCVVTATFLTEDSYLGSQTEPLTLNRYNYCVSSYLNYTDPSGNWLYADEISELYAKYNQLDANCKKKNATPTYTQVRKFLSAMREVGRTDVDVDYVLNYNYQLGRTYVKSVEESANERNSNYECEIVQWISSRAPRLALQDSTETYLDWQLNRINNNGKLKWNQEKIDKVWEASVAYYNKTKVQVDPRLLLAIIIQEGTGSFNTDKNNLAADGQNGVNENFDNDLALAMDFLGGKIIAYTYYHDQFSAARQSAFEKELPGIKDYDDILHYLNWNTPRLHLISPGFSSGIYAGHNDWNRGIRAIYSNLAFDGAAQKYTDYVASLDPNVFLNTAKRFNIEISEVEFKEDKTGQNSSGNKNGEYTIVGVVK